MDINKLSVYVTIGGEVIKIATGTFAAIKAAFAANPDIALDNEQLDRINAEYERRIAEAKAAAGL